MNAYQATDQGTWRRGGAKTVLCTSTPACFQQSLHLVKLIVSAIPWVKNAQTGTGGGAVSKKDDARPFVTHWQFTAPNHSNSSLCTKRMTAVTTTVLPLKYKHQGNHRYILRERERHTVMQITSLSQAGACACASRYAVWLRGWAGANVNVDLPFPFRTPPEISVLMCVLSLSLSLKKAGFILNLYYYSIKHIPSKSQVVAE